jgi:hypothetical protein
MEGDQVVVLTRALGLTFRVSIDVLERDDEARRPKLDVYLPFGIVNHEMVTVTAAKPGSLVRFG